MHRLESFEDSKGGSNLRVHLEVAWSYCFESRFKKSFIEIRGLGIVVIKLNLGIMDGGEKSNRLVNVFTPIFVTTS
jgi:hypothetical protein